MNVITRYLPTGLFAIGASITYLAGTPKPTPLVRPLTATLPMQFLGVTGREIPIGEDERRVSGVSDYLYRGFVIDSVVPVSLYVGYHATQQGESRMHSPTLCLPGSGWTPIESRMVTIPVSGKPVQINRYVLQKGQYRILVYYWFQGRGQITAGEARLKLNTFVDALLSRRDEEALVRIVVPVDMPVTGQASHVVGRTGLTPDSVAEQLASATIPALDRSLPPAP